MEKNTKRWETVVHTAQVLLQQTQINQRDWFLCQTGTHIHYTGCWKTSLGPIIKHQPRGCLWSNVGLNTAIILRQTEGNRKTKAVWRRGQRFWVKQKQETHETGTLNGWKLMGNSLQARQPGKRAHVHSWTRVGGTRHQQLLQKARFHKFLFSNSSRRNFTCANIDGNLCTTCALGQRSQDKMLQ